MAAQSDLIEKAVEGALKQIEQNAPEEFKKLNAEPTRKAKIIDAARETATETLKLTEEFRGQPKDIAPRLSKHLPDHRVKLIQGGLEIPTFRLAITQQSDGKHLLEFTREGKEFLPSRSIDTIADIEWGSVQQYASILVEAVILVMSAVGISVSASGYVIERAVSDAALAIRSSSRLERALQEFVDAWGAAGLSPFGRATALFHLIKDSYSAGILWTIIKSLCSNMAWYDWLETAAKVSAMIIASLATDGVALIAEIALVVMGAVDFARKMANIIQLSDLKKTL